MLDFGIGGSREGKTGTFLNQNKPSFSAYLHPPILKKCTLPVVIAVKDVTSCITMIGRRFYSFPYRWILPKAHHKIYQPDTVYALWSITKNGIYVKASFMKNFPLKFHQNRLRNKEVIACLRCKVRIFLKQFAPRTPKIGLCSTFYAESESSLTIKGIEWPLFNKNQPINFRDNKWASNRPLHQLTYSLEKAHQ